MTHYFLIDENDGSPLGIVDADQIQSDAVVLAYAMATFSDDPEELDRIAAETLTRVGSEGYGFVAAAALRMMTQHILEPVLAVTDRLRDTGALHHDLRDGLFRAYENATATLTKEA